MKLHSADPWSLHKNGRLQAYPQLNDNARTDVLVIGSGISGALTARELAGMGISCIVIDKHRAASGSTAASTSLIQYEIDTPLKDLIGKIGERNAVKSYRRSLDAVLRLQTICEELSNRDLFTPRPSMQLASYKKDIAGLKKETELRAREGFDVRFLDETEVRKTLGMPHPGALLSEVAGELDAYLLTHLLLKKTVELGGQVFDHTEATSIRHLQNGVEITTGNGHTISASKLVIACGYESGAFLPRPIEKLYTTYALVSTPMEKREHWYRNCLLWETAHPYLYCRVDDEQRIIAGGKDTVYDPLTRFRLLPRKTRSLERSLRQWFPQLNIKTDRSWAGVFAETKDGLPYIGSIPERPHSYFALGFGGNGIVFSVLAAEIIASLVKNGSHPDEELFSFRR